jgi:hypothetical protein
MEGSGHLSEGLKKTTKKLGQDSHCPGRHEPGTSRIREYEAGMLTTWQRVRCNSCDEMDVKAIVNILM